MAGVDESVQVVCEYVIIADRRVGLLGLSETRRLEKEMLDNLDMTTRI